MKAQLAACIFSISAPFLLAQKAEPQISPGPLPPGKLLASAPENSEWIITITAAKDSRSKAERPAKSSEAQAERTPKSGDAQAQNAPQASPTPSTAQRIAVSKTGSTRHITGVKFNDIPEDIWVQGTTQVMWARGMQRPLVYEASDGVDPYYTRYCRTEFPGFEWISASNFKGYLKIMGRDCMVFRGVVPVDAPAITMPGTGPAMAFVDEETRLPVFLIKDGQESVYQFVTPPAPIVFPPELADAVNARKKHYQEMTKMPARPY